VDKVKGQAGFTLMELAVVLTIIAVLAAVAAPRFADLGPRAGDAAVHATAAAARAVFAMHVAATGLQPTCDELFARMAGVTGAGPERSVSGPGGVVTTITCSEPIEEILETEEIITGGATEVAIWNNRSGAHGTSAAALVVTF
jgi:prepilin-type N-terminal cleavage/methylation domain-containing protein